MSDQSGTPDRPDDHDDGDHRDDQQPGGHGQGPGGAPNPFAGTPLESMFGQVMGGDMSGLQAMFGQISRMFAPHEGTLNWDEAQSIARQVCAQSPDPTPDAGIRGQVADAARLAEHWLDDVTVFPSESSQVEVWSRAEWVEKSMPVWRRVVEPVAQSVVEAMADAVPEEAKAMAGPMLGMLHQFGGVMFTQQVGQAVGTLSSEVIGATDVGFPVTEPGRPAIVAQGAKAFGEGLGISSSDVLLYLVLRECAHQRLYAATPWLRDYVCSLIEEYGRGMTIDTSGIEQQLASMDLQNIEAVQEAMSGGLFDLEPSAAQKDTLQRLETVLALVEGWVDDVVGTATKDRMPDAGRLAEAVRRRRASGGPAEDTFAALVGLELRPRRLRDASTLWGALRSAEGVAARDGVWAHRDLLPTSTDLDDPLAFAQRTKEAADVDVMSDAFEAELNALLDSSDRDDGDASGGPAPA